MKTRAWVFVGVWLWLLSSEGRAGEAPAPGARPADEPAAPAGRRLPFAGTIDALAEKAGRMPPLSGEERIERAAGAVSGLVPSLSLPFAIGVTVVGFVLMLFGRKLFRAGIVLYLMSMLGLVGGEIGRQFGRGMGAVVGGLAGGVVGAGVALPLRAVVRALVGALSGGILVSIIVQSATSDWRVTLVAAGAGIVASAVLTFFFPGPLLVFGFSLFGAVLASVGILSVATEPVAGRLAYGPAQVAGVVLAAALSMLFQGHLEKRERADG